MTRSHRYKSKKKQHASELLPMLALSCRFGLFKRISRKCIPSGIIHAIEIPRLTKRKAVKDNHKHGIKATISTWKNIKIQFNFAHWFIEWMSNQTHRQKKIAGRFPPCHHSLMAPYKITQCYDQATIAYDFKIQSGQSVYIERIAIPSVQKKGQQWILCFKNAKHHGNDCRMNG